MLQTCERFGCLPSQLYRERGELMKMQAIEELGGSREQHVPDEDYF